LGILNRIPSLTLKVASLMAALDNVILASKAFNNSVLPLDMIRFLLVLLL
jgi:hypothetical protein